MRIIQSYVMTLCIVYWWIITKLFMSQSMPFHLCHGKKAFTKLSFMNYK